METVFESGLNSRQDSIQEFTVFTLIGFIKARKIKSRKHSQARRMSLASGIYEFTKNTKLYLQLFTFYQFLFVSKTSFCKF